MSGLVMGGEVLKPDQKSINGDGAATSNRLVTENEPYVQLGAGGVTQLVGSATRPLLQCLGLLGEFTFDVRVES